MKILQYIKIVLIILPVVIYYHFRYMIWFARHPEKYDIEYRYKIARKEIRFAFKWFRVDYNIKNFELFSKSKEKSLIISNHFSIADPIMWICNSEKPITFIAKKESFKIPFVGKVAKAIDVFPLDRQNLMSQISEIKKIVAYLKDENKPSVIVYIEGTRNRHPENKCLDFHPGTLKIAQMANCSLLVAATYGSFRVMDKHEYHKHYLNSLSLLKTIDASEMKTLNTTELAVNLKNEVDNEVSALRELDRIYYNKLNKKSSKK